MTTVDPGAGGCIKTAFPALELSRERCRADRSNQLSPPLLEGSFLFESFYSSPEPRQTTSDVRAKLPSPVVRHSWADLAAEGRPRNPPGSCFAICCECIGRTGRVLCYGSVLPNAFCLIRCVLRVLSKGCGRLSKEPATGTFCLYMKRKANFSIGLGIHSTGCGSLWFPVSEGNARLYTPLSLNVLSYL